MSRPIALLSALFLFFLFIGLVTVSSQQEEIDGDQQRLKDDYKAYLKRHKKKYPNSAVHDDHFKRWKHRKARIENHNRKAEMGQISYTMDDNEFTDLSDSELNSNLFGLFEPPQTYWEELDLNTDSIEFINKALPPSVDLRNVCMPPVKYQAPCGACWAFTATTAIEYQTCVKNNFTSVVLSEQQLIDCSTNFGNKGCRGGTYTNAWNYTLFSGGLVRDSTYPLAGKDGICQLNKINATRAGKITAFKAVPRNEISMQSYLLTGPITVSIVATNNFLYYSSGIFDDPTWKIQFNATTPPIFNHGITLVGYGRNATSGINYWIGRNSWGHTWGSNGYIFIKRNVNMMGLATYPYYVSV